MVAVVCACTPTQGFECGTPLPTDTSVIRSCTEPHQVCVCGTNSCAVPATDCDSGLRYVAEPFAAPSIANDCVEPEHAGWRIEPGQSLACGSAPDASIDATPSKGDGGIADAAADAAGE